LGGNFFIVMVPGPEPNRLSPSSWSRDGRYLLYRDGSDIWALPLMGSPEDRKPFVFFKTQFRESHAQFSPDGKWVAYGSGL
jgi:Tol biopolymer transport system component